VELKEAAQKISHMLDIGPKEESGPRKTSRLVRYTDNDAQWKLYLKEIAANDAEISENEKNDLSDNSEDNSDNNSRDNNGERIEDNEGNEDEDEDKDVNMDDSINGGNDDDSVIGDIYGNDEISQQY
jgi:hypothetical protein